MEKRDSSVLKPECRSRWPRSPSPFYEVWFCKFHFSSAFGTVSVWLRLTVTDFGGAAKDADAGKAEVWAMVVKGAAGKEKIAAKESYPAARMESDSSKIQLGDCVLTEKEFHGFAGGVRWNLSFRPSSWSIRHMPEWLGKLRLAKSNVTTPEPDLRVSGTLTLDGENFEFQDAHGSLGHIWGTRHANRWAWGHGSDFLSADGGAAPVAAEALSAQVKLLNLLPSPPLTVFFLREAGKLHSWNTLANMVKIHSSYKRTEWLLEAPTTRENPACRLEISASPSDFMGVTYQRLNRGLFYCYNTGRARARLTLGDGRIYESGNFSFETVSDERWSGAELAL